LESYKLQISDVGLDFAPELAEIIIPEKKLEVI